jgi:hypothetical protein
MKPNSQIWNQLRSKVGIFDGKDGGEKSKAIVPLTTKYSKSFQRSFVFGSIIVHIHIWMYTEFRTHEPTVYMEFRGIEQ